MKKRRTLVISLLLVAAIALGVGYAATNGTLTISGEALASEQSFNVVFTSAKVTEKTEGAAVTAKLAGGTELTTTATTIANRQIVQLDVAHLCNADDFIEVEFTVENHNDFPMYLSKSNFEVTGLDAAPFTATPELTSDVVVLDSAGGENASTTVVVTFKVGELGVSNNAQFTYSINLKNVSAVDPRLN